MITYRKNSIIVGILFLFGFLGIPSVALIDPILNTPDYLSIVTANRMQFISGVLLLILMAVACIGIAIWLYPVLKRYNETLAIGAVSFRIIEAALFFIAVLCLLTLIPIGHEYINSGNASDVSYFKADEKYVSIVTKHAKSYILDSTLKKLEEKLPTYFIRVHKSYMVAIDKIDYIENNAIKIGNKLIPVSSTYKITFQNLLNKRNFI